MSCPALWNSCHSKFCFDATQSALGSPHVRAHTHTALDEALNSVTNLTKHTHTALDEAEVLSKCIAIVEGEEDTTTTVTRDARKTQEEAVTAAAEVMAAAEATAKSSKRAVGAKILKNCSIS